MAVEFIGTALLLATVVGSRLVGERLSGGLVGITYLVNTVATASVMVSLLLAFGPLSGAHFNPALTFGAMLHERLRVREACAYVAAQLAGGFRGRWGDRLDVRHARLLLAQPIESHAHGDHR